ncbi:hypothetical protein CSKR_113697 [Clonorchis sinensis]|uniref:Uncharacterized protein n=1 Tax=Clonorchis sinensis TaxID=79923 RepID=A0A3R7CFY7_CLOSI|nr:hypothetical protein CSKR_113697 [Clonorchis sinensis]
MLIIEQGSKTLICISFTKLNIHLLLERVFLNFSGYSLTVTQMQVNVTKRLLKFRNRSHFSRDALRIYEKTCYSHASSVVSTVARVVDLLKGNIQRKDMTLATSVVLITSSDMGIAAKTTHCVFL